MEEWGGPAIHSPENVLRLNSWEGVTLSSTENLFLYAVKKIVLTENSSQQSQSGV